MLKSGLPVTAGGERQRLESKPKPNPNRCFLAGPGFSFLNAFFAPGTHASSYPYPEQKLQHAVANGARGNAVEMFAARPKQTQTSTSLVLVSLSCQAKPALSAILGPTLVMGTLSWR